MRTLWIGHLAIALAAVVAVVPASRAQAPGVQGPGKSAETGVQAEERQARQSPGSDTVVSVVEPIGRVSVGPELVNGEPIYVRRTTVRAGMTIVEVSTTPFAPIVPANEKTSGVEQLAGRPDQQPAGW